MLDRGASAERLEQLVERALLRRAREDAVAMERATAARARSAATRRVRRVGTGDAAPVSAAGSAQRSATPSGTT